MFRYTLSGDGNVLILTNEAVGWGSVGLKAERSDTYMGVFYEFVANLQFFGEALDFIKDIYNEFGTEGEIKLLVEIQDETGTYLEYFKGVLNLSQYREIDLQGNFPHFNTYQSKPLLVECPIDPDNVAVRINNRDNVPIDLSNDTGIDGQTLTPIEPYVLPLHSKIILFEMRGKEIQLLEDRSIAFTNTEWGSMITTLGVWSDQEKTFDEFNTGATIEAGEDSVSANFPHFFEASEAQQYIVELNINASLTINVDNFNLDGARLIYAYGQDWTSATSGGSSTITDLFNFGAVTPAAGDVSKVVNINLRLFLDLAEGDKIWFLWLWNKSRVLEGPNVSWKLNGTQRLNVISYTRQLDSPANTYLIHEAIARCLESISGKNNVLRSDYFGRTDSLPRSYATDGCASALAITNGRQLRADTTGKQPTIAFGQLYNSLKAVYNIGMGIEQNEGAEEVRLEPLSYFFQDEVVIRFDFVPKISIKTATDYLYNLLEYGYAKYEFETLNSLDDVHVSVKRNNHFKVSKGEYRQVSNMVASAYAIELARREQFNETGRKGNKYDDNNFLICLSKKLKIIVTSIEADGVYTRLNFDPITQANFSPNLWFNGKEVTITDMGIYNGDYTIGPVYGGADNNIVGIAVTPQFSTHDLQELNDTSAITLDVPSGKWVAEKDESFSEVNGIISSATTYNLRISPERNILRHANVFNACMDFSILRKWQFAEAMGNAEHSSNLTGDCVEEQNGTLLYANNDYAANTISSPLFRAELITFEAPITVSEYLKLRNEDNRYKQVEVSDRNSNRLKGYIKEMEHNPTQGTISMVLLRIAINFE